MQRRNRRMWRRSDLDELAIASMREHGLDPGFNADVERQLAKIKGPGDEQGDDFRDMRALLWCSIDNDDSRDLDQLTVSHPNADGSVTLYVAIADVDTLVHKDTPIDIRARTNTTSVYTSAIIFPMLPEKLSTDLTSLNPGEDRLAMVSEMHFGADGSLGHTAIYRARVHNHAQLAYDAVSDWIDGSGEMPRAIGAVKGLEQQLRTQDALAQQLRARRREKGALEFQTFQPRAVFRDEQVVAIREQIQNRARQIIEEFMIATNGVTARFLASRNRASMRRVVKDPEKWARIVELVATYGEQLPLQPDSLALENFLAQQRRRDPLRFPDLSLTIIKLMGSGEYVVEIPGGPSIGHFGLAVRDYTHSTAPNRRFPDLITQRLLKAALANQKAPYSHAELAQLAAHCTAQEDMANKVERKARKSEAALLLQTRIGDHFDGVVTGIAKGSTWVRIFEPPAEGKLMTRKLLGVGMRVSVRLASTNVERGYIDFELF